MQKDAGGIIDYNHVIFQGTLNAAIALISGGTVNGMMAAQQGTRMTARTFGRMMLMEAGFGVAEGIIGETGYQLIEGKKIKDLNAGKIAVSGVMGGASGIGGALAGEVIGAGLKVLKNTRVVSKAVSGTKGQITKYANVLKKNNFSGFRELMEPEVVTKYNEYWLNVAEEMSDEVLDNQIMYIRSGGITKPGGGKYRPAKISATVDLNNGNTYVGYNGTSKFNPSMREIHPDLQKRIEYTKKLARSSEGNVFAQKSSFEVWSVENCAEVYSVNNAVHGGASMDNIFINTKVFRDGTYAPPCRNCQITFGGINMPKGR